MAYGPIWIFLHLSSVAIWIGGMFFAYVCLRPAAVALLEPPLRLRLWCAVFARFFPAVWGSVGLILASGLTMLLSVGFASAPHHWHWMLGSGLLMMAIYGYVYFVPYRRLAWAVETQAWPDGGAALNRIRQCVGINLLLGGLTIGFATIGQGFS